MHTLTPEQQHALFELLNQLDRAELPVRFPLNTDESLLANPAVALQLIDILLASNGRLTTLQQEHRGKLLQYCLKLLFIEEDAASPDIAVFKQRIEQQLTQYLQLQLKPDFRVLRAVINILFRADVLISDQLLAQMNQAEYPQLLDSTEFCEEVLHNILAEIAAESHDASLYELAAFLFEQFSQLPPPVAPMIATMLLQACDVRLQQTATLFLLHPNPLFRQAMIEALPSLAQQKLLRATDLQRLVWLRNWLQQTAHPTLDRTIKLLQRQQLSMPAAAETTIVAAFATALDHSGAMMLMVELKQGRQYLLFSFMLKQSDGVKDAFITPPLSRKNLQQMKAQIQGELPMVAIDINVMVALLEHFLLKSREHNRLPLALLLFRELTAGVWSSPHAIDEAFVRPAVMGQPYRKNKREVLEFFAGWATPWHEPKMVLADYIQTQMEPIRERWRERFLLTALVFSKKANHMNELLQAASDIAAGRPLLQIEATRVIAMYSLRDFGGKSGSLAAEIVDV